ncbi:1-aminocyclopropane-1-carboxylate deaminase/D-cysteine desulfhydrase [Ekhidna sp.]|uniref:1-aminocyclopropane-1-carboxylate deaminase/D-cysteine desulfhydrase n=1 Tax=Ekhidna sp. TaxID=2608089 RepID=UPI003B51120C
MVNLPTPTEELNHALLEKKKIRLYVKRDDLIHPEIMGNKWRKLKYNLLKMKEESKDSLITMGGAFSNHIAATAAAAKEYGIKSIGIIRGDELKVDSNPTLQKAHADGMQLQFVSREEYKNLRDHPTSLIDSYPNHYYLPEGGTNEYAIRGCSEILDEIPVPFDVMVTPIGTGGTMVGLIKSAVNQKIIGVSCLKGSFIYKEIKNLVKSEVIKNTNYSILEDYHFGGYAKTNAELIDFINWFKENFNIQLDPIYTGKTFFGVWDMIKTDKFEKNLRIVLLHTGGIQGILGFNRKNEIIIN